MKKFTKKDLSKIKGSNFSFGGTEPVGGGIDFRFNRIFFDWGKYTFPRKR